MMCGINAEPRNPNLILEGKNFEDSSPQKLEEVGSGCCHDQVKEISRPIFSSPSFVSLCSIKFSNDFNSSQSWISSVIKQVSLECMEQSMDRFEIEKRFFYLISQKFFF
jgi:hypothetical protein